MEFFQLRHDVTVHTYYLWPHIVAVQSCDPIDRAQLKQRDYGQPCWEIVLRPQYELCERRQTADRLHCSLRWRASGNLAVSKKSRSKEFWTFQNSALRLKRLVRPYGDLCDLPRPHCDRSSTAVRPYCDLTRFGRKIGRSTVAALVWLGY